MSTEALAAQSTISSVSIVAWRRHDVDTALLAHCEGKTPAICRSLLKREANFVVVVQEVYGRIYIDAEISVKESGYCYHGSLLHQGPVSLRLKMSKP